MKYVVAGSFSQASNWAREKGLAPMQWRYVSEHEKLQGLRDAEVVFIGTWENNPDIEAIRDIVNLRGYKVEFL